MKSKEVKLVSKTESELVHDKETAIHNIKTLWNHYIRTHISMLEATGIDDEGSLVYLDDYEKLRDECANDIENIQRFMDELKSLNEALEGNDI